MCYGTKLPTKMVTLLAFSQVGHVSIYGAMFGYLPNLLHELGQKWTDIGFYQGVVLALFMVAFCLSSLVTGKIIDRCGSRTLFAICLFLQASTACFIAFTSSMEWLFISVVLIGLSSASEIVAKVIVYEISNEVNKAYVYNFAISMPCNVSLFVGPALGGILSFPTDQYPGLFPRYWLLTKFPILLPNLILSFTLLVTSLFAFIMSRSSDEDSKSLVYQEQQNSVSCVSQEGSSNEETSNDGDISMSKFHRQRNVIVSTLVMIVYALAVDGFSTLLGVWLQTPSTLNGMGYSPRESGLLMLISGMCLLVTDSLIVGKAIDKLGLKRGFMVSFTIFAFLVSIIWTIPKLHNKTLIFSLVTITVVLIRTSVSGLKVALFAYMNNLVPNNIRGGVISVRECIKSLISIAAHPLAGSTFAWSLGNNGLGFPFNYVFTFFLISLTSFVATFSSVLLDNDASDIDSVSKKEEDL